MEALRKEISTTVFVPDFFNTIESFERREEVVKCHFEIIDNYYQGIKPRFLSNGEVKRLCLKIDHLSYEALQMTPGDIHLLAWLWIGDMVEVWMQMAIELEEFEAATNLRKLLNSEYA